MLFQTLLAIGATAVNAHIYKASDEAALVSHNLSQCIVAPLKLLSLGEDTANGLEFVEPLPVRHFRGHYFGCCADDRQAWSERYWL